LKYFSLKELKDSLEENTRNSDKDGQVLRKQIFTFETVFLSPLVIRSISCENRDRHEAFPISPFTKLFKNVNKLFFTVIVKRNRNELVEYS
jgi:hypothetical protein